MLLLVYEAFASFVFIALLAIDFLPSRQEGNARLKRGYSPKTLVIVPCRGIDLTLHKNLSSIASQSCKNYDVIAVVDSNDDAAVPIIKKADIMHIVAHQFSAKASGKVNAILTALYRFKGYEVYVVADSDITVDRMWLRRLISPLSSNHIGISTMFPMFEPVGGFWSKVKHVWGFVGEGLMKRKATRFGWGGSLAFRKGLISKGDLDFIKNSRYSVSDDICLTKIAKRKGLGIAYTSASQPIVRSNDSFSSFAEWSNRQTVLSILGYGRNFYYGILFYSAEILVLLSAIYLSIYSSILFSLFFIHLLQGEAKTYTRSGRKDPEMAAIVAVMPFMYIANLIVASRKRSIKWRGRIYRIRGS
ncbi:MAG: glycosyltransferase family 2 protein [Candidatus Micrarchaeota archaeon]|nr:glycosyltransferase family 2 protein [Candidatus Micrarchaeota archaeon]